MNDMVQQDNVAAPVSATPEKMLSQAEVDAIVAQRYNQGREKGRSEIASQGPSYSEEDLENKIMQAAEKLTFKQNQTATAERIIGSFANKIEAVASEYPELSQQVIDENLMEKHPWIIGLADSMPNTAEIMKELMDNPEKLALVSSTHRNGDPKLAFRLMQKISKSIADNEKAAKTMSVPSEPLSHAKPSTANGDAGRPSFADLKKASWLRG